ncbi:MAG: hypothetical protein ACKV2T_15915 [Kofleriaceae bacterium]
MDQRRPSYHPVIIMGFDATARGDLPRLIEREGASMWETMGSDSDAIEVSTTRSTMLVDENAGLTPYDADALASSTPKDVFALLSYVDHDHHSPLGFADANDGTKKTSKTETSAKNGNATASKESETKHNDGSSSKTTASGTVGADGVSAKGSHTAKTKDGKETKATGNAAIDAKGNVKNADVDAEFKTKAGWKASVGGSYKVVASDPKKKGDAYVVDWVRKAEVHAGGGKSGGKLGGEGKVEKDHRDFGTRTFKTEKEAKQFQDNAAAMIQGAFGAATTAKDALSMQIGETRGVGDGSKLSGGLNATWGVATVGAGAETSKDDTVVVERLSPTVFQVTVAHKDGSGSHSNVGIKDVKAGGYTDKSRTQSTTLEFDLSTPEGKTAFDEYQRTKQTPTSGATFVSQTDAERKRRGTRLGFGKYGTADVGVAEQWESSMQDRAGQTREVFGGENSYNVEQKVFGKRHDKASLQIEQTLVNGKHASYSMAGEVDSSDGAHTMRELANMTGVTPKDAGAAKSSGHWHVDIGIDDNQVDKFLAAVDAQKYRGVGVWEKMANPDHLNELRKLIHAAKTPQDKMRALSYFISESGLSKTEGLNAIRAEVFGMGKPGFNPVGTTNHFNGTFHADLKLEKDKHNVFTGLEGRLVREAKIDEYKSILSTNPQGGGAVIGTIQADIDELDRKMKWASNPSEYTDLPPDLRTMQLETLRKERDNLIAVRDIAAKGALKDTGPAVGKNDTADPATKAVRELREKVADLEARAARHRGNIKMYQAEINKRDPALRAAARRDKAQNDGYEDAIKSRNTADDKEHRQVRELRAAFVLALGTPDKAIEAGQKLVAALDFVTAYLESAEDNYNSFIEYMDELVDEANKPATTMTIPATR